MEKAFSLQIITPSDVIYEGNIQKLFLKDINGELEILANHENMIISTIPYATKFITEDNETKELFVSSAIVKIVNGEVTICTDAAEFPDQIDFERAEAAKKRAEQRINDAEKYEKEIYRLALQRAIERLKLKK